MPLPMAPPMIRPSASVAKRLRERAIQTARTTTATALTAEQDGLAGRTLVLKPAVADPGVQQATPDRRTASPSPRRGGRCRTRTAARALSPGRWRSRPARPGFPDVWPRLTPPLRAPSTRAAPARRAAKRRDIQGRSPTVGRNLPRPRAFGAHGLFDHHRDARYARRDGRRPRAPRPLSPHSSR